MSFAVELPGEANPLNESTLLHALTSATSNKSQQVRASAAQLQSWETKAGYFTLLQDAFIQTSLPTEVRLLAVIQLKNGIDRYWRKSASNAISQEDRQTIRSRVLRSGIDEPQDTLANQNAIIVAKIARHDFPSQWPELFKELIDLMTASIEVSQSPKQLSRVLLITHHVVKELSTIRLQRSRASFLTAAPPMLGVLWQLYLFRMQQWQEVLQTANSRFSLDAMNKMSDNERALKIIRRLVVSGYDYPHRHSEVCDIWQTTKAHTELYLQILHYPNVNQAYMSSVGQQLKQLAKLHVDMARDHPTSFALLPDSVALVYSYWNSAVALRRRQLSNPDEVSEELYSVYEAFNLRALLILTSLFKSIHTPSQQFKYKNNEGKDEPPRAKEILKTELLRDEFLLQLCNSLVDVFCVYTAADVEVFTTEPEEWEMREGTGTDIHERSVKPCAERVLLALAIHHKDLIIEPLLAKLAALCSLQNEDTRSKDAGYSALGIAAPILHNSLDFNSFFTSSIIPELQVRQPEHSILRRRIALVLSQWISLDISETNRPLVYQVFQHLLDKDVPENDQTVRITAGKQFKDVVLAWEFNPAQFIEYGSSILLQLVALIQEVDHVETKLALLQTVGAMIDAMDSHIQTFADQVVALLPQLWNENSHENLMKQSIVTVLFKLVKALGKDSGPIHTMMLPTIRSALEPGSETQLYLLDDSLDLWTAIIKQTPTPATQDALSTDLVEMLPLIYPVYEMETEYIRKALKITESYILLAPVFVIQETTSLALTRALKGLLTVRKPDIIDIVAEHVELLIRAAEVFGTMQSAEHMLNILFQSKCMSHILNSIHGNYITRKSSGPHRVEPPNDWRSETNYLCVLARITLVSPQLLFSTVQQWALARHSNAQEDIKQIIDEWFSHMDSVASPAKSKLLCLGLTKLLETGETWILERLQEFMALWTSTILDLRDGDDIKSDSLVYSTPPVVTDRHIPEDDRKKAVMLSDLVHTINLGQFVQFQMQNVIAQCGGEARFQEEWLVNVDKTVIKAFGELGLM